MARTGNTIDGVRYIGGFKVKHSALNDNEHTQKLR